MESARLRFAEKSRGYAQLKEGAQAREEGLVRKEEAHAREESVVRKEEDAQAREESFVVKVADIAESRNSRISRASMRWGKVRNDMWTKAGGDPREYWAADTIQRLYMRHKIVFSLFGSTLFSRKKGSPADYGELYFPTTNSTAPFITVSDTTSASMLGSYMELTWKLRRPEVLISVTGGAQDFSLPPNLQRAFDRGLASAASSTNAWVFTGGTHTGVMKLVAAAFSEYSVQVPLIAVVPLGCVNGRDAFEGARKASCPYLACGEKPSATGAPLNPSHTHFVLVDDGKVAPAAWGGEIGLRSSLESTYAQDKAVPLVLVVVQGGPGTLNMVLAYAKNGQAILLVRDSGGAADAVADVVLTGHTDDPKFQSEGSQRTLGQIHRLHRQSGGLLITCYSLSDVNDQGHQVEMSTMLLKALIKNLRPSSRRLAAAHKQPPALQESLSRSSISLDGSVKKRSSEEELGRALVLAVNCACKPARAQIHAQAHSRLSCSSPSRLLRLACALSLPLWSALNPLAGGRRPAAPPGLDPPPPYTLAPWRPILIQHVRVRVPVRACASACREPRGHRRGPGERPERGGRDQSASEDPRQVLVWPPRRSAIHH